MTLKERKTLVGYTSQNCEWEKRSCAKCHNVDDRSAQTVCREHEMRVSYFGVCRDFSGAVAPVSNVNTHSGENGLAGAAPVLAAATGVRDEARLLKTRAVSFGAIAT